MFIGRKPKLLLIAGYFPPARFSVASIRPWSLAKYLKKRGWEITIVTPDISSWTENNLDRIIEVKREIELSNIKIIYTNLNHKYLNPSRFKVSNSRVVWFLGGIVRRLFRKLGISDWYGWKASALKACKKLLPEDVDIILATGEPWIGFEIAYILGKKLNKPYIMDYRDLWTKSPYKTNENKRNIRLENNLIKNSSGITVVSPLMKKSMLQTFNPAPPINVITNGFDPAELFDIPHTAANNKFNIVYAGTLSSPERSLDSILQALILCKDLIGEWEFHYFGSSHEEAQRTIGTYELEEYCRVHGNIPRRKLYSEIVNANLAIVLHLNNNDPTLEELGWIPGKIYELIGLESNFIVITPEGSDIRKIVDQAGYGKYFDSTEIQRIADYIVEVKNGRIPSEISPNLFSWDKLSMDFEKTRKSVV